MSLKLNEFRHGKGLWKFNNSLLQDTDYLELINNVIDNTKEQYAAFIYNRNNLNDIPDNEIYLTINDQLFLETVLMEIRAKTISYASFKKRQTQDNEEKLKKEIESLELKY